MKKTVGKAATELLSKPDSKQGLIDTSLEMQKNFLPEVEKCIENHKMWTEPFYIVVINKRERLILNAIRQYFLARKTLPTPDLDQTVFKYFPSTGDLKYLWTVPDHGTIDYLMSNANEVVKEEQQLLEFCTLFVSKELQSVYGE